MSNPPKIHAGSYYTSDPKYFLSHVWPMFLKAFSMQALEVNSNLDVSQFNSESTDLLTASGFPVIFYPHMLSNTCGPADNGYIFFSSSVGYKMNSAVTAAHADVFLLDRVTTGAFNIVVRNNTTGREGTITTSTTATSMSQLPVNPAVTFTSGHRLSVRISGSATPIGNGLWLALS